MTRSRRNQIRSQITDPSRPRHRHAHVTSQAVTSLATPRLLPFGSRDHARPYKTSQSNFYLQHHGFWRSPFAEDIQRGNYHVYVSPPWPQRDGIPYNIARIMEFLPDEGTTRTRGKGREIITRVRLAWYYRPSDLNDRPSADPRLLLAAIFSEVQPVSHLRARCYVRHKDKISDLQAWKKKPDHFYFQRVFDPYIRKEFDVLRSADVTNLAERDVIGDLTDNLRLCETCEKWAPSQDSVRCDTCKCYYHMACVNPPLVAKPAKGYGWTCGACSRHHDEHVQPGGRHSTPVTKSRVSKVAVKSRGLAGLSTNLPHRDINSEDRYFKMCLYTVAEDTLDPDDLIFPKAATRVGARYQAVVGPWVAPDTNASPQPSQIPDGVPERGGDDTIEMMSVIVSMSEEERKLSIVISLVEEPGQESARRYSLQYLDITQKFNSTTRPRKQHGPEMRAIKDGIKTRSIYEVVRFYGDRLREENRQSKTNTLTGKSISLKRSRSPSSDDESSVYGFGGDVPRQVCGACRSKESAVWWKAPRGLPTEVMCDQCGISWRKYGDIRSGRIEEPKKSNGIDKRENTPQPPVKRTKVSMSRGPSPPLAPRQHICCCCKKSGPVGRVVQCTQCGVQVHAGEAFMVPAEHDSLTRHPVAPAVYGVTEEDAMAEIWLCELCQNEKSQESSLNPNCLLCPRTSNDNLQSKQSAVASTILRLSKPTEGRGWVHTLCSVFVPETSFTDATRLRLVEGISSVSDARWACSVCRQEGGAVVSCASGCGTQFHVSCAWMAGHAFGFEIRQSKNIRRDPATIVEFRGEVGVMKASIRCKTHSASLRPSFDICSLNTNGESALQLYCRTYKQVSISHSYGLLRKAKRLDTLLRAQGFLPAISSIGDPLSPLNLASNCRSCGTNDSPCFWTLDGQTIVDPDGASDVLCNLCRSGPLSRGLAGVPEAVTDIGSEDIRLEKIAAAHATPVQAR
ncbi:ZNF1 protein [Rhizoctonia solani AG-1 IA]|uniref:ZNF1 protein n=1 Tax=Thanatephorus cucumeris (strain AG1-IA) TaxID=983506 RepID=L8X5I9_THACA|nr:ZNF1 protein [Rhizoctonia solani AG-1 IA]